MLRILNLSKMSDREKLRIEIMKEQGIRNPKESFIDCRKHNHGCARIGTRFGTFCLSCCEWLDCDHTSGTLVGTKIQCLHCRAIR